jgi:hypothetical protein
MTPEERDYREAVPAEKKKDTPVLTENRVD